MDWQSNIIDDTTAMGAIIQATKTVAVLGIKTEEQSWQAAYYVPKYLQAAGFEVIPVPVYYPEV
ncbi:MAG TPA: CoA-binding protein, partial [Pyrinomonadaceae bacterium]|nr:CoA-binding protein [Pyrinomonadaceae bacterium]